MPPDLTVAEARRILRTADLRGLRKRAGISAVTLARALGVDRLRIHDWERRGCMPRGWKLPAYARVIAGLARHEEISSSESGSGACDAA
jgi:DNA-binding transcriptional regulator YiaG